MTSVAAPPLGASSKLAHQSSAPLCAFDGSGVAKLISLIRERLDVIEDPIQRRIGVAREGKRAAGITRPSSARPYLSRVGWATGDLEKPTAAGSPMSWGKWLGGWRPPPWSSRPGKPVSWAFMAQPGWTWTRSEAAIRQIASACNALPWGSNLIHTPNEPDLERRNGRTLSR